MLTYVKKKTIVDAENIVDGGTINWLESIYVNGLFMDRSLGNSAYGQINGSGMLIGQNTKIGYMGATTASALNSVFQNISQDIRLGWDGVNEDLYYLDKAANKIMRTYDVSNTTARWMFGSNFQLSTGVANVDSPSVPSVTGYDFSCRKSYVYESMIYGASSIITQYDSASSAKFRNLYTWFPGSSSYQSVEQNITQNKDDITVNSGLIATNLNSINSINTAYMGVPTSEPTGLKISNKTVFAPTLAETLANISNGFHTKDCFQFKTPISFSYNVKLKTTDAIMSTGTSSANAYITKFGPKITITFDNGPGPSVNEDQYVDLEFTFDNTDVRDVFNAIFPTGENSRRSTIGFGGGVGSKVFYPASSRWEWGFVSPNTMSCGSLSFPDGWSGSYNLIVIDTEFSFYIESEYNLFV